MAEEEGLATQAEDSATALESLSLKELKALIARAGLSYADCIDRSDLHARASEAQGRLAAGYVLPPRTPKVRRRTYNLPLRRRAFPRCACAVPAGSAHHLWRFMVQG